jgi:hypothetical protein
MHSSKLVAAVLVAALCSSAQAQSTFSSPSDASMTSALISVALPFLLVSGGVVVASQSIDKLSAHSRWTVTQLKDQPGGKTEARMHCDDGKFDLMMTVLTPTVRAQRLAAGDLVDIDRVGDVGYVVRKDGTTIGVLPRTDSGMVHSKARG